MVENNNMINKLQKEQSQTLPSGVTVITKYGWRDSNIRKEHPTLSGVKQMLEVFPEMDKKLNFEYYKYYAKQRINMLANTVRQFVGRHKNRCTKYR